MLVLALQFSKGGADRRQRLEGSTADRPTRRSAPPVPEEAGVRLLQNGREDCVQHQHQTSGGEPTTEGGSDEDGQRINWVLSPIGRANAQLEENQLLRKEVIQPHLPVRLPCYDFTPITDPTFDGSLHKGWATGFGCCRLSWCDGRCVQGPGTYSPRRC